LWFCKETDWVQQWFNIRSQYVFEVLEIIFSTTKHCFNDSCCSQHLSNVASNGYPLLKVEHVTIRPKYDVSVLIGIFEVMKSAPTSITVAFPAAPSFWNNLKSGNRQLDQGGNVQSEVHDIYLALLPSLVWAASLRPSLQWTLKKPFVYRMPPC
jgi:hypothetical protein